MAKRIVAQYSNRMWMQPCSLQNGSLAMTRLNLQCRNASHQETQQYYSFKEISEQFNPYAKFVGILFSAAAVLTGVVIYATNMRNRIELFEARTEAKLAENKVKIAENEAKIAENDAKSAHQFLLYGYSEKYVRFQKEVGLFTDGDSPKKNQEKQEDVPGRVKE